MRKSILLLAGAGIGVGAGFLYGIRRRAVGRNDTATKNENDNRAENTSQAAGGLANSSDRDNRAAGGASMGRLEDGIPVNLKNEAEPVIDDRGTDQHEASEILKSVRDAAFDASDEKLALALGRPIDEIEAWTSGAGTIDGDVVMKARTLAMQRGVEIQ